MCKLCEQKTYVVVFTSDSTLLPGTLVMSFSNECKDRLFDDMAVFRIPIYVDVANVYSVKDVVQLS